MINMNTLQWIVFICLVAVGNSESSAPSSYFMMTPTTSTSTTAKPIKNSNANHEQSYQPGAAISITCKDGYKLNGTERFTCTNEGYWNGTLSTCTQLICPPPSPPDNGHYKPNKTSYNYSELVTYSCDNGYRFDGESGISNTSKCTDTGAWSSASPACIIKLCPPPTPPDNGHYKPNKTSYNYSELVTYSCDNGYRFDGESGISNTSKCTDTGAWSSASPPCINKLCPPPTPPDNGHYTPNKTSYNYGESVTYSCDNGYRFDGESGISNMSKCTDTGAWSSASPACIIKLCPPPTPPDNGHYKPNKTSYNYGESVTYSCDNGYRFDGESGISNTSKCTDTGSWSLEIPACIKRIPYNGICLGIESMVNECMTHGANCQQMSEEEKRCVCVSTHFHREADDTCLTKIPYKGQCDQAIPDYQCETREAHCLNITLESPTCVCNDTFYLYNNACVEKFQYNIYLLSFDMISDSTTTNTATLRWFDNPHFHQFAYFKVVVENDNGTVVYNATVPRNFDAPYTHIITGLEPGQHYSAVVHIYDSRGVPSINTTHVSFFTLPSLPTFNVDGEYDGVTNTSFEVTWTDNDGSFMGKFLHWHAVVRDETSIVVSNYTFEHYEKVGNLTGLQPASRYTVEFYTSVPGQNSRASPHLECYTRPSECVGVSINTVHENNFTLTILNPVETRNIFFKVITSAETMYHDEKNVTSEPWSAIMTYLTTATNYSIAVYAVLIKADGTLLSAANAYITWTYTGPPAPTNVSGTSVNSDSLSFTPLSYLLVQMLYDVQYTYNSTQSIWQYNFTDQVQLVNLIPGTRYLIRVYTKLLQTTQPTTIRSDSFYEFSIYTSLPAVDAAGIRVSDTTTDSITIVWSKPTGGDFKNYQFLVNFTCTSPNGNKAETVIQIPQTKNSTVTSTSRLDPGTSCNVFIQVCVEDQFSEVSNKSLGKKTQEAAPGKVRDLKSSGPGPTSFSVSWKDPFLRNGVIRRYEIIIPEYKEGTSEPGDPYSDDVDCYRLIAFICNKCEGLVNVSSTSKFNRRYCTQRSEVNFPSEQADFSYTVTGLQPYMNYSIEVRAYTFTDGEAVTTYMITGQIVPFAIEETGSNLLVKHAHADVSDPERQIAVQFPRDVICNEVNGRPTSFGLVVAEESLAKGTPYTGSKRLFDENISIFYKTWFQVKDSENMAPYIASSDIWNPCESSKGSRKKRSTDSDQIVFVVGTSGKCSGVPSNSRCNGELVSDKSYRVKVYVCTDGGCSETKYSDAIATDLDKLVPVAAIAGSVTAVLVVIIIAAVIICMKRKNLLCFRESVIKEVPTLMSEMKDIASQNSHNIKHGPVKLADFPRHVDRLHRTKHFYEAFSALKKESKVNSTTAADSQNNRPKNRFSNILAYDHSRVKLHPTDDEKQSNYINANYIPGYTSKREYIACQGPLVSTFNDFWRMTWEQNVDTIVMLNNLDEKDMYKSDKYWPDLKETVNYGDIVVCVKSETILSDNTIRVMEVKSNAFRRTVRQFCFRKWPDMGCPGKPPMLLDLVKLINENIKAYSIKQGPMIVHCSSGTGRTGTFIAVDYLLQYIWDHDDIDIYKLVLDMRNHRCNMVQTEEQYVYIHECIKEFITTHDDDDEAHYESVSLDSHNDEHIYEDLTCSTDI